MRTGSVIALAFAAALGTTTSAGAVTALPFNTGVDVTGGVDQAWSIVGGTNSLGGPGYTGPAYTVLNSTNPPPDYPSAWITTPAAPGLLSNWDSPTVGATGDLDQGTENGTYDYQTTFTAGVGKLSGMFAADNEVSAIFLNGLQIYFGPLQSGNGPQFYNIWTVFSGATCTTLNCLNTLTFDVVNYGDQTFTGGAGTANPSGLNVEFTGLTATPLPSTWTMLIAGFVGLGFFAYRGSKKNGAALSAA